MKRRGWIAARLVVALAAGLGAFRSRARVLPANDTPTCELKKEPFVRRVSVDGYLRAVVSTPVSAPVHALGALKIAWLVKDGSKIAKGDLLVRFDPSTFEKNLLDSEADRASAEAKIAKERVLAGSALRGRERTTNLSNAELAATQAFASTDPEVFSRNQIIESGIDEGLSPARMQHARDARSIEGTLSRTKVDLMTIDRKSAELKIQQARQGLSALEVRAPHDGIVVFEADNRRNLPHVGDTVWAGQKLATLPILDAMEAEGLVLEADAGGLQVGVLAQVILEAHPGTVWDAKIKWVDALPKPRMREVPIQYFAITLDLAKTDRVLMKPGERIHATLILDRPDAIAVPRQAVFEKEGRSIVYRLVNGRFEPQTVKLGASSPGRVVVEEGVSEHDRVALRDPTQSADKVLGKDPASEKHD